MGFAVATPADDAAMRRLLRENPMRGAISVSFEREPHYFADTGDAEVGRVSDPPCRTPPDANEKGRSETCPTEESFHESTANRSADQTIVAYDHGRLVCMGRCSMRLRYLNGELRRVGYLGELRLDAQAQHRVEILRGGYRFFRELRGDHPADFYFTSIAADNERARRVLERGLPGLPRYEFLTEFVTLLVSCRGGACRRPVNRGNADVARDAGQRRPYTQAMIDAVNTHAAHHQLAAHWSAADFAATDDILALHDPDRRVIAAAALWDQRAWRQTVVRGYARGLAAARPLVNLAATLLGRPRLPRVGAIVPSAFLSPLALAPGYESRLPELIRAAFAPARARGVELLTLGFAASDPELALVRRYFRCREYRSRLYRVRWPGDAVAGVVDPGPASTRPATVVLDGRTFRPEVALL